MAYQPDIENLIVLSSVGSTNDHTKKLAQNGYPAGTVVWAHDQTAGRGRSGNEWISIPGNLYTSIILRPETSAARVGQMSFVVAVALLDTLQAFLPPEVEIGLKWPNDILLAGKKVAGILLETQSSGASGIEWVVVGLGVNVTGAPQEATSISAFGIKDIEAGHVLEKLNMAVQSAYQTWQDEGFEPIRQRWLAHAINIGKEIEVRLPKKTLKGTFAGLDICGSLQLILPDGSKRQIASGEVYL